MSISHYSDLDDRLAVGSSPAAGDAGLLASRGVTALVSLQSDADLAERGLDWAALAADYAAAGIDATRVPVTDFDRRDLLRNLDRAVRAVDDYAAAGHKVYVHCNAGLNRSPCTVTGHLVSGRGMALEDAVLWIEARHRCVLYYDVLEQWALARQGLL